MKILILISAVLSWLLLQLLLAKLKKLVNTKIAKRTKVDTVAVDTTK